MTRDELGVTHGAFITLTIEDQAIAERGHANVLRRDLQLFNKRLRKELGDRRYKFLAVGEYGDKYGRPHYHQLLFGVDFKEDRYGWRTKNGNPYFRSATLEKCWHLGNAEIGHITPETINYVCRYTMKKQTGELKGKPVEVVDQRTGEVTERAEQFALMSRGGRTGKGLGHEWLMKYGWQLVDHDRVIQKGREAKPPRYYTAKLTEALPEEMADIKERRRQKAVERRDENTHKKRQAKRLITKSRLNLRKTGEL